MRIRICTIGEKAKITHSEDEDETRLDSGIWVWELNVVLRNPHRRLVTAAPAGSEERISRKEGEGGVPLALWGRGKIYDQSLSK